MGFWAGVGTWFIAGIAGGLVSNVAMSAGTGQMTSAVAGFAGAVGSGYYLAKYFGGRHMTGIILGGIAGAGIFYTQSVMAKAKAS